MTNNKLTVLKINMSIFRVNDFTEKHYRGWKAIPHMCIKTKHPNGYAWYGLRIEEYQPRREPFYTEEAETLIDAITSHIYNISDAEEILSELHRTVDTIESIVMDTQRSINYEIGNGLAYKLHLANNVTMHLYEPGIDIPNNILRYGGYVGKFVSLADHKYFQTQKVYNAIVFHQSVIVQNYIKQEEVVNVCQNTLLSKFQLMGEFKHVEEVSRVLNRNVIPANNS